MEGVGIRLVGNFVEQKLLPVEYYIGLRRQFLSAENDGGRKVRVFGYRQRFVYAEGEGRLLGNLLSVAQEPVGGFGEHRGRGKQQNEHYGYGRKRVGKVFPVFPQVYSRGEGHGAQGFYLLLNARLKQYVALCGLGHLFQLKGVEQLVLDVGKVFSYDGRGLLVADNLSKAEHMGERDGKVTRQHIAGDAYKAVEEEGAHGRTEAAEILKQCDHQVSAHNDTHAVNESAQHLVFVVLPDELIQFKDE